MLFPLALGTPLFVSGTWQRLMTAIRTEKFPCAVYGVSEGQKAFLAAALAQEKRTVLLIVPAEEAAARLAEEIQHIHGGRVAVFPARAATLHHAEAASREMTIRRVQAMAAALAGETQVIVASVEAMMLPLIPPKAFSQARFTLRDDGAYQMPQLITRLVEAGYVRQERVEAPGQFAQRGGLLDIYPVGEEYPVRMEFFGDEVDSIRAFDAVSQRSVEKVREVRILPAGEMPLAADVLQTGIRALQLEKKRAVDTIKKLEAKELRANGGKVPERWMTAAPEDRPQARVERMVNMAIDKLLTLGRYEGMENDMRLFYPQTATLLDYLREPLVLVDEPGRCKERSDNVAMEFAAGYQMRMEGGRALPIHAHLLLEAGELFALMKGKPVLALQSLTTKTELTPQSIVRMEGRGMHSFRGQFEMLKGDIARWNEVGTQVFLMAGGEMRAQRLQSTLMEYGIAASVLQEDRELQRGEVAILPLSIAQGFEAPEWHLAVVGERELYGAVRSRKAYARKKGAGLHVLNDLTVGDYVVHEMHGIGRYEGIIKLQNDGVVRDYLKIRYRGDDVLYVPTEQMDRVQKYIGSEGKVPAMNRLGGNEWRGAKARAQKAIVDMTQDLLRLYAQRQAAVGFAFSPDTPWQRQLEDNFPYEETPDQLQSIEEIKDDMESPRVMDRLLCGDVGYGKTEEAIRAVFKAVMDRKQVAFLAPTTILAHQHYNTMLQRFADFGVQVEVLSRFRSPAQIKDILSRLAAGKIDVLVGTHRILSDDVKFRDLGLLVVDEEQRFGVAHKEKIKKLRTNVDVLTLTATPIPRTLHMSMVGLRDISVIDTPPEERFPVQTMVMEYDDMMIRDAILREVGRGGQVFFVYNRVESIDIMYGRLTALLPGVRIVVGHGQMGERALEKVMMQVLEGEADVLLATTIIESGLDIPRVNTLIVYDADRFGLAQLYQLRGRVGRSNRLAYAYLTYRPEKVLSEVAEKRLNTIREFTEFGSGFKVAMRDLEIRGAGNLLGAEQSGHMASIGYGLFCKMVEDTVAQLRGEKRTTAPDPVLDLLVDAHIPESYIADSQDRLEVYRRIAAIREDADRVDVTDELIDRFGDIPAPVERLMDVAMIRSMCMKCGIERMKQTETGVLLTFSSQAGLDPARMLELVKGYKGRLALSSQNPPGLRLRLGGGENTDALQEIRELCLQIVLCIPAES